MFAFTVLSRFIFKGIFRLLLAMASADYYNEFMLKMFGKKTMTLNRLAFAIFVESYREALKSQNVHHGWAYPAVMDAFPIWASMSAQEKEL
jgi:hypothetical protein